MQETLLEGWILQDTLTEEDHTEAQHKDSEIDVYLKKYSNLFASY